LRAKRYRRIFSALLVDIEKFAEIAENFGTEEEEKVLKDLAKKFQRNLRRVDIVAKLKIPERFGAILPETPSQGAWVVARKFLTLIQKYFWEKFKIKKGAFITILTFEPTKIDPKKDTPAPTVLRFMEAGMKFLKEKGQKNIIMVKIDREIEKV